MTPIPTIIVTCDRTVSRDDMTERWLSEARQQGHRVSDLGLGDESILSFVVVQEKVRWLVAVPSVSVSGSVDVRLATDDEAMAQAWRLRG